MALIADLDPADIVTNVAKTKLELAYLFDANCAPRDVQAAMEALGYTEVAIFTKMVFSEGHARSAQARDQVGPGPLARASGGDGQAAGVLGISDETGAETPD